MSLSIFELVSVTLFKIETQLARSFWSRYGYTLQGQITTSTSLSTFYLSLWQFHIFQDRTAASTCFFTFHFPCHGSYTLQDRTATSTSLSQSWWIHFVRSNSNFHVYFLFRSRSGYTLQDRSATYTYVPFYFPCWGSSTLQYRTAFFTALSSSYMLAVTLWKGPNRNFYVL